ncbi:MAG: peptidoglycan bridge formation glycyltransferase FemA/FemB family protein [Parcubacteria group bacterium]
MLDNPEKFIRDNSPDGGFLQSSEWRKFQEKVGRKTHAITGESFNASIVSHKLPLVGTYFYVPRGPVMEISNIQYPISNKIPNSKSQIQDGVVEMIKLAEKENAGWIRIDPASEDVLEMIKGIVGTDLVSVLDEQVHRSGRTQGPPLRKYKITKAPHNVQPREVFIIDITKTEEELLAEMKSKTRYNVRLAEKKGVSVKAITNNQETRNKQISNDKIQISNKIPNPNEQNTEKYIAEFLRLVKITARRDGITSHPESYYRQMLEIIPSDILKLYVAEYEGKVIAANLVLFYGETCTYMHGASDDEYRNVMAPYLLQWQQIKDAKKAGCKRYDFGGVSVQPLRTLFTTPPSQLRDTSPEYRGGGNSWSGITRFKTGFSPKTASTIFPGSYDIIINPRMYWLYRGIQKVKSLMK